MTKEQARAQLIQEDTAHFGRPLTAAELQAIDIDLNRACHGGPWIEWGSYKLDRMIEGRLFLSRADATRFLTIEAETNKGFAEQIRLADARSDKAFDNARAAG